MTEERTPPNVSLYESKIAGLDWNVAVFLTLAISVSSVLSLVDVTAGLVAFLTVPVILALGLNGWSLPLSILESVARHHEWMVEAPISTRFMNDHLLIQTRDSLCAIIKLVASDLSLLSQSSIDSVRRGLASLIEQLKVEASFISIPHGIGDGSLKGPDEDYNLLVDFVLKDVHYFNTYLILKVRKYDGDSGLMELEEEVNRTLGFLRQCGFSADEVTEDSLREVMKWNP
ncbi:MAG: hypothetical protein M1162_01260 [Candidatus Thermoplasmatota archaeon]|nr:hypothetical protein [Candidatus Thermoplasmatota archaeon]